MDSITFFIVSVSYQMVQIKIEFGCCDLMWYVLTKIK
jgi:hypothetical protein